MQLTSLKLSSFRNFSDTVVSPCNSLNVLYGVNGAGKSSLLEAIHLLGFGRSFRTNKQNSLINHDSSQFTVFCSYQSDLGDVHKIGCSRDKTTGLSFSVDGTKSSRLADMVKHIPMQIFTPQSSDLIIGAPLLRRRFVDWSLFHVEHSFGNLTSTYTKALSQRNALLRGAQKDKRLDEQQLGFWSSLMVESGEEITQLRMRYISHLNAELAGLYQQFMPEFTVELGYNCGWDKGLSLEESLAQKANRDIQMGHSTQGPHKADIKIRVNGLLAADVLSRGQLRILVSLMQISQMKLLSRLHNKSTLYLIDDIAAELDLKTREFFLDLILETNTQVFVTAIERSQFDFTQKYNDKKVFHVEHNQVNEE